MTKKLSAEALDALNTLRENIKPGDTVYTILRHVSKSGMSRSIDLAIMREGKPWTIDTLPLCGNW